jgi:hypothetical protein
MVRHFGTRAGDQIVEELMSFTDGPRSIEDWLRVAAAIDAITSAPRQ